MKNKTILITIASIAIIASTTAYFLDPSVKHYGVLIGIGMIASMAILMFLVIAINFFALAFCLRQIRKLLGKK